MRIIICDKSARDAESCRGILEKNSVFADESLDIQVVYSCERLLFELSDEPDEADVIITEMNFGGKMNGLDAVKKLRSIGYSGEVIFLTNDRQSVFDSFEVRPANYLLKDSLGVKRFIEVTDGALKYAKKRKRDMLTFACAGEIKNIALEDILYFEVVQKIVEVHYADEIFEFYSTMPKLENQLHGKGFVRTHRSFLVNREHISYAMGDELVLDNDEIVPFSQKYAKGSGLVNMGKDTDNEYDLGNAGNVKGTDPENKNE